jgi:hypothetical protein
MSMVWPRASEALIFSFIGQRYGESLAFCKRRRPAT